MRWCKYLFHKNWTNLVAFTFIFGKVDHETSNKPLFPQGTVLAFVKIKKKIAFFFSLCISSCQALYRGNREYHHGFVLLILSKIAPDIKGLFSSSHWLSDLDVNRIFMMFLLILGNEGVV